MKKFLPSTLLALCAFIASANSAVLITVNGEAWSIDTAYGSFDGTVSGPANPALLMGQPWWNSSAAAGQFASALGTGLGSPNIGFTPAIAPFFAWNASGIFVSAAVRDAGGVVQNPFSFLLTSDPAHFAVATRASVPDGGMTLVFLGIALAGLAAVRRTTGRA